MMAGLAAASCPALAYAPGSGTLFSENFNATLQPDWEQGNGSTASPWTRVTDGADKVFYADGIGPTQFSPTRHWARHFLHPCDAGSFSIAIEYRSELGAGYAFDLDVEQRAPLLRKYRLHVNASGSVSLWRTVDGVFAQAAASAGGTIPVNTKRWIRFAIGTDPSGHPRMQARVWSGGATAEPSSWTLDVLDDRDTLARVHRFELAADGPRGIETWIDDLDAFGNVGSGVASSITTIYLWEGTHLDIGFTLPPDDIEAYAKTHLDQVLASLDADAAYRWTIEESWYLDRWWERSTDAERQHLLEHLREGRLKLAAGYATLHTTTAGHEELIRNLYYSTRFARDHGGFRTRVWITDDVPGTTFAVPEILARSGVDYFVGGMNTSFGGRTNRPNHGDRPMWWVGPDGSRVLSWFTFDSYAEAFDYGFSWFDNLPDLHYKLGKKLPEQEEAGYRYPEFFMMRAFDNNYAGFKARDLVNEWNATYATPRFVLATAEEFFDHMLAVYGPDAFPSFSGDYGCAWSSSHALAQHTEEMVRHAHRAGRNAEALLAAGSVQDGQGVPRSDVDFLYRRELEVDEHSGAGGWPGYWNREQLDRNNRIHLGYAQDAKNTADSLLAQGLGRALTELPASGDAVAAVNPLGRPRDGWVQIALPPDLYGSIFRIEERGTGAEIPFQRFDASSEILFRASAVPAVGYRVYDLVPGAPTAVPTGTLAATATTLENDFYRLEVSTTDGSVTSLLDKTTGKQLVDPTSTYRFNRLASNVNSDITAGNPPVVEAVASASVSVEHDGPMVASLRVSRTGTPHVETTYRLHRNENRVEIENVLDRSLMPYVPYGASSRAYTVTLPFNVRNFEIRTESTTRFVDPAADRLDPSNLVFDWHNVEHSLAFWDSNQGILYALDSVDVHNFEHGSLWPSTGYTNGRGTVISMMLARGDEYQFADGSIGPYEIEPGTSTVFRYTHHFRATPPFFDPVAASRFGFEALEPLGAALVRRRPGNLPANAASFFSVDAPGVLLYTVKGADDGDGIVLRMTELAGTAVAARVVSDTYALSSPMRIGHAEDGGTPLGMDGNAVLVPLSPYETATVRVQVSVAWSPILLRVDKDAATAAVRLSWSGGVPPYTLERAENAPFTQAVTTILDEQPATSLDDPVFSDGKTYFYLVK
jgi:hypothetical protein